MTPTTPSGKDDFAAPIFNRSGKDDFAAEIVKVGFPNDCIAASTVLLMHWA